MTPNEPSERRNDLRSRLIEALHDPFQLRLFVIGVVLMIGYSAVYTPLYTQIETMTFRLQRDRQLAVLADDVEGLQSQCDKFAKYLPQNTDSKEWMQYMHEGIRGFPLKLSRLDVSPQKSLGPYSLFVIQVELEGYYYDLDRFLRWLESNPRLIRVDSVDIGLTHGKPGQKNGRENKDDMFMKLALSAVAG
ncbi:MAG: type 4a pilus biogenesis protein PilO [Thermoguttaceae bacterium]